MLERSQCGDIRKFPYHPTNLQTSTKYIKCYKFYIKLKGIRPERERMILTSIGESICMEEVRSGEQSLPFTVTHLSSLRFYTAALEDKIMCRCVCKTFPFPDHNIKLRDYRTIYRVNKFCGLHYSWQSVNQMMLLKC